MKNNKSEIAAAIARQLLQIKAIKLSPQSPFTWASGMKSPIYCDNRIVLSHPKVRQMVIHAFHEEAAKFTPFDKIAGVATAGIAHGALLADAMNLPFVYVRSKPKEHGRQNQIEGEIKGTERVLVIEDLISTGGSCLKAVEALQEVGCEVAGVIAIFSYGFEQASTAFEKAQIPFDTLSNYDTLIDIAVEQNYVSKNELETLQAWRKSPKTWKS